MIIKKKRHVDNRQRHKDRRKQRDIDIQGGIKRLIDSRTNEQIKREGGWITS